MVKPELLHSLLNTFTFKEKALNLMILKAKYILNTKHRSLFNSEEDEDL